MKDISAIPLFARLDPKQRAEIFGVLEPIRIERGQFVFQQYDPADSLFIIDEGRIQIFLPAAGDGSAGSGPAAGTAAAAAPPAGQVLAVMSRTEVFGEFALLNPGLRTASALALEETRLFRLKRADFESLSSAAEPIRLLLTDQLVNRIANTNLKLKDSEEARKALYQELSAGWSAAEQRLALCCAAGPRVPEALLARQLEMPPATVAAFLAANPLVFETGLPEAAVKESWRGQLLQLARARCPEAVGRLAAELESWYLDSGRIDLAVDHAILHGDWTKAFTLYGGWRAAHPATGRDGGPEQSAIAAIETSLAACLRSQLPQSWPVLGAALRAIRDPDLAIRLVEETVIALPESWTAAETAAFHRLSEDICRRLDRPDRAAFFAARLRALEGPPPAAGPAREALAAARRGLGSPAGKKSLALGSGLLACLLLLNLPFARGLPATDLRLLAIVTGGMIVLGFSAFPMFLVLLGVCAALVIAGCTDLGHVAIGYANPAWLFFACILIFSVAVIKSGLLYRLTLHLIRLFPKGYFGQVIGLFLAGFIVTVVVPSGMIRVTLSIMLTANILTTLGLPENSRAAAGIRFASFLGMVGFGPYLLTGYATNSALYSMAGPAGSVSWLAWSWWALPAFLLYGGLFIAAVFFFYRPAKGSLAIRKATLEGQLAILGRISRDEKITGILTILYVAAILCQPLHRLDISIITMLLVIVLFISGVLGVADIRKQVDWSLLLFLGGIFSIAQIVRESGLPALIQGSFSATWNAWQPHPVVLLVAIVLILSVLSRLILPDVLKYSLLIILPGIAGNLGIHPWVIVFVILIATDNLLPYLNLSYFIGIYNTGDPLRPDSAHRRMTPLKLLYFGFALAVPVILYPWWQWLKLVP